VINAIIITVVMIIKWNSSKKNMVINTGNNILDESLLRATIPRSFLWSYWNYFLYLVFYI
jgi:hypothetical protein